MSANPSEQKRGSFSSLINDWESGLGSLKQRVVLGAESVRTRLVFDKYRDLPFISLKIDL